MSPTPSEWRCPASFCFPPVCYDKLTRWPTPAFLPDPDGLSWESSSWEKQREEVTEHLCQGGLHQDSIYQGYTLDDQNALLQWSNLQPTCWAPEQGAEAVPPADCPGYYQVTILGKEITPVACSVSHATVRASRAALNAWVRMHLRLLRTRAGKFYFVAQSGFYCTTFMLVLSSFKLQLCFIRNHVTFKHQELKKKISGETKLALVVHRYKQADRCWCCIFSHREHSWSQSCRSSSGSPWQHNVLQPLVRLPLPPQRPC